MFWRLGFAPSSPIDTLLDSDDYTLQQLMDEEDLVQECKQLNNRLLDLYLPATATLKLAFSLPMLSCASLLRNRIAKAANAVCRTPAPVGCRA
jgi:hypothetical protein